MKKILNNKSSGFTLIELLVVISIIGLLSSVVLASLVQAREKAKSSQLTQNLVQVRTALELYRNDKGQYPSGLMYDYLNGIDTNLSSNLQGELVGYKYISKWTLGDYYDLSAVDWDIISIYSSLDSIVPSYAAESFCGGIKTTGYIMVFASKEKLTLPRPSYTDDSGSFYNNTFAMNAPPYGYDYYCIGQ